MKILIICLFLIYEISGQFFGLSLPQVPVVDSFLKPTDEILDPGVKYATLIDDLIKLGNDMTEYDIDPGVRYASTIDDLIKLGINVADYDNETLEEAFLTTPQLIAKYGYPSEIHTVITKDQYILEMHRIPGSPHATNNGQKKQPIFLMHGLLDSSGTWVIMRPDHGLGYLLADMGYDVWLGNSRGNRYSRKHVTLNPDGSSEERYKYWDFSWHETGIYDLPASIDYVLANTSFEKLHYIGHSQGGSVGLVLGSEVPEYNDKLLSMQLLAPAAFMSKNKRPLPHVAAALLGPITFVIRDLLGKYEFLPRHDILTMVAQLVCTESSILVPLVCANVIYLLAGYNPEQMNLKMLPIVGGHTPAGAATNSIFHYLQLIDNGRFCGYDEGPEKNLAKYGQTTPPDYKLHNIRTPVVLYHSDNDLLVDVEDIKILASKLPNLIEDYRVPDPKFSHVDFVWAKDVVALLYNRVFKYLKRADEIQPDDN